MTLSALLSTLAKRNTKLEVPPGYWRRDWELLYRAADILWARLGDRPDVRRRRLAYLNRIRYEATSCSEFEGRRFPNDCEQPCSWIAKRWCALFDEWARNRDRYIFDDGFAALFLLRLLWPNDGLLLRGQYDSRWKLRTSSQRAEDKGAEFVANAHEQANRFLDEIKAHPVIAREYGSDIPEQHVRAILQHYGFPSDLLDFTYSWDVALYFAEGDADIVSAPDRRVECGAVYAFPAHVLVGRLLLTTLPPAIMRPSLQRGIFVELLEQGDEEKLEQFKFVFHHQFLPVWNGLGGVNFGSAVGLGRYLFPASDPIDSVARPYRKAMDVKS